MTLSPLTAHRRPNHTLGGVPFGRVILNTGRAIERTER